MLAPNCSAGTGVDLFHVLVDVNMCSDDVLMMKKDVMTPNPDCAYLNTTISDALLAMKEERWLRGCFLHLPALDEEGNVVALMDVLQVTYGVVHKMKSVHASQDG